MLTRPVSFSPQRSAASSPKAGSEPPDDGPRLDRVAVLVVEDDEANRKLVELVLAEAGARVTGVVSAEEAFQALAAEAPRVIVLDLVLPGLGGLSFVKQLKVDAATKDVLVVAVSALSGREMEKAALAAGCVAYLRKPIDPERLVNVVASVLGDSA